MKNRFEDPVRRDERQGAIADYLEEEQWGLEPTNQLDRDQLQELRGKRTIHTPRPEQITEATKQIDRTEVDRAIRSIKKDRQSRRTRPNPGRPRERSQRDLTQKLERDLG